MPMPHRDSHWVQLTWEQQTLSDVANSFLKGSNSITDSSTGVEESIMMRLRAKRRMAKGCSWFVIIYISTQKRAPESNKHNQARPIKRFLRVYRYDRNNFVDRMVEGFFNPRNAFGTEPVVASFEFWKNQNSIFVFRTIKSLESYCRHAEGIGRYQVKALS